jgi:tRNA1(Val) A37 N6-methylase TrmN6
LLGDAYEYLIGEFAAGAGKKGGEFYTPAQVSRLLAQIVSVGKKRVKTVYDPTCGSGSLLLRLKDYVEVSNYFGQELNPTTYNLARMNMILHGVHFDHFKIKQGDTLTEDMLPDLKAEAVVANPPFSAKWKGDSDPQLVHDDRFSQYGRLSPKGAADYAFVTHMLYHLSDNGTMAVVLPHGALFPGAQTFERFGHNEPDPPVAILVVDQEIRMVDVEGTNPGSSSVDVPSLGRNPEEEPGVEIRQGFNVRFLFLQLRDEHLHAGVEMVVECIGEEQQADDA